MRRAEVAWETASSGSEGTAAPAAVGGTAAPVAALASDPQGLKGYIIAAIAEERQLREAEAERQREEMRQRAEERRQEFAALSEGPYERYNLKVNSLAKVLNMTEGQKQAYVELMKQYDQKSDEARTKLRDAARAAAAAAGTEGTPPEGGGRGGFGGRGRGDPQQFQQYRELSESLQTEFTTQLGSILTASQLASYAELSESARSFQSTNYVAAPGEENPMDRFMGGGGPGGTAGFRGVTGQQQGGQRGGRGGGR
jgi:hypothetical protein